MTDKNIFAIMPYNCNIGPYYYQAENKYVIGQTVVIPIRNKQVYGIIWSLVKQKKFDYQLKQVVYAIPDNIIPILSIQLIKFINWVANYNMVHVSKVLAMTIPICAFKQQKVSYLKLDIDKLRHSDYASHAELISKNFATRTMASYKKFLEHTGLKKSLLDKLVAAKIIIKLSSQAYVAQTLNLKNKDYVYDNCIKLSEEQADIAQQISNYTDQNIFSINLLQGVTGSGKTEVFLTTVIKKIVAQRQILIIGPEITLVTQLFLRLQKYFGDYVGIWHSELSALIRHQTWHSIVAGEVKMIVGTRSALFLPYLDLSMIIVDEEHAIAFKQENNPIYNARDMAIVRAKIDNIPIILSSASPSIETGWKAMQGKCNHFLLKNRYYDVVMPKICLLDMRNNQDKAIGKTKWLANDVITAIDNNINNKQQSLIFLNRRGYAPTLVCSSCGKYANCNNCSTNLILHSKDNKLRCHFCDYVKSFDYFCHNCNTDTLVAYGPGVERIAQELIFTFPKAKIAIASSDTIKTADDINNLLNDINEQKIDIIVSTQILTKGLHFSNLTFVCVVDADMAMNSSDLRAAEKTYHVLLQVAGRAGREKNNGMVIIQTYNPQNKVFSTLQNNDYVAFLKYEIDMRRRFNMPPFSRLVAIIITGKQESIVQQMAKNMVKVVPNMPKISIMGPAPAPISKINNYYRWRILIRSDLDVDNVKFISHWLNQIQLNKIKIKIDVDPYNFL